MDNPSPLPPAPPNTHTHTHYTYMYIYILLGNLKCIYIYMKEKMKERKKSVWYFKNQEQLEKRKYVWNHMTTTIITTSTTIIPNIWCLPSVRDLGAVKCCLIPVCVPPPPPPPPVLVLLLSYHFSRTGPFLCLMTFCFLSFQIFLSLSLFLSVCHCLCLCLSPSFYFLGDRPFFHLHFCLFE